MHQQGGKSAPIGKCEYVFAVLLGEVGFSLSKLVLFPSLLHSHIHLPPVNINYKQMR